jgi:hypothetical protein
MNFKVVALLVTCIIVVVAAGWLSIGGTGAAQKSAAEFSSPPSVINSHVAYSSISGANPIPLPTAAVNSGGSGIPTKIISTADITIEVPDVTNSVETLQELANQTGGYVSSTNIMRDINNQPTGMVVLRIPATAFDFTLTGVKALGTVKSLSTESQDVTAQYVDVQAQITSYQNQLAQYNTILKQSQTVDDILKVQEQIDQVQTELDRLNAQLKYLNSEIDYSTITVTLQEPEPVGGQGTHDFVAAVNEGIAGFLGMIDWIIIFVISVIPLVIIGGAGYGIYRWWEAAKKSRAEQAEKK